MKNQDFFIIESVIKEYFKATHKGDLEKLKNIFHPDCRISGLIHKELFSWDLNQFLKRIQSATENKTSDEDYDKEILSIDLTYPMASVKVRSAVGELNFIDYMSLIKLNERWLIQNKLFFNS